jgi:predicted transposase/invertase (TIGR01784 family)
VSSYYAKISSAHKIQEVSLMMRKNNGNEKIEQMAELKVNRKYKDTVFRMLFSDKERLLELYNAVSGKNYNNADELEIVTLENAVYMGMKNDLAFLLNMNIYLYEHQSTVNPNMPLRDLFYITSEFSELVELKSLYSSALIKLPTPNFVVFYNGDIEIGDVSEYRLSDSYMTRVEEPALELRVTVLNVNYGKNVKLMEQCESLKEYAQYVALVRKYKQETGSLDDGVKLAIEHCINEGILEDFLRKNRSEVEMTSIFEYNKEEEDRKLYEAGVEQGIEKGIEKGVKQTKRKVACSLMKENMPLDKIASIIDVGVKELEKWKTEME